MGAALDMTTEVEDSETGGLRRLARDEEARLVQTLADLARSTDRLAANRQFRFLLYGRARMLFYGHFNQFLIYSQFPSATFVQGPRQWERMSRKVLPGAKPIRILAPSRSGRPWPFKEVSVFDVSQTSGPAIPDLDVTYRGEAACLPKVEAALGLLGLQLFEEDDLGISLDGVTLGMATGGGIRIRRGLAPAERLRVLVHECAHELLHLAKEQRGPLNRMVGDKALRETEADATAFVVLSRMGIDYNCPSYIVWQGGDGKAILRSFKRIVAAARAISLAIEGKKPRVAIPRLPRRG